MPNKLSNHRVVVEVAGAKESAEAIRLMGERAYNTWALTEEMVTFLADEQRERIKKASAYEPLETSTVERKLEEGENPEIFRDEARMIKGTATRERDALYRAVTVPGAPGQLRRNTRTWAVFGVESAGKGKLFYARFVQNVRGHKRKILAISAEGAMTIAERSANYITHGWSQSPTSLTLPG